MYAFWLLSMLKVKTLSNGHMQKTHAKAPKQITLLIHLSPWLLGVQTVSWALKKTLKISPKKENQDTAQQETK